MRGVSCSRIVLFGVVSKLLVEVEEVFFLWRSLAVSAHPTSSFWISP